MSDSDYLLAQMRLAVDPRVANDHLIRLADVQSMLSRAITEIEHLRQRVTDLTARLEAAERVVEAARARFKEWTRETYVQLDDALAAYDAASRAAGEGE